MSKTGGDFPTETKDSTLLAQRIKKDLAWIVASAAVALAAAVGTYMAIIK